MLEGPLFDGRAMAAIDSFETDAVSAVAERGEELVVSELQSSLRNPTGHYISRVDVAISRSSATVHDSGVIYGPWLEGLSRRNQTTRFKGYASFRRARQRLQAEATQIAETRLPALIRGMGG